MCGPPACHSLALCGPELVSTPLTPGPRPAGWFCVGASDRDRQLCRPTSLGSILGPALGRPHVLHPCFQAGAPLGLSRDPKSQPCCLCSFKGGTGQDLTLTHAHHTCALLHPVCSLSAIRPRCQGCQRPPPQETSGWALQPQTPLWRVLPETVSHTSCLRSVPRCRAQDSDPGAPGGVGGSQERV